jgi:alpha-1,6-mannosyltransferase
MAIGEFLPVPNPTDEEVQKRQKFGIFLFVIAGAVFRSEVAILMAMQLIHLLILPRMSLQQIVPAGLESAVVALGISIPIDSYFWQKPLWPELWGFYYNAIQGNSAEWGTSPYMYYFTTLLARLLLNPLITALLIPLSLMFPETKRQCRDLVVPSALFLAIYSLQPHKESRFIIYVVPPLTAAASLSASYIWSRRSKAVLYKIASGAMIFSVIVCFAGSMLMLLVSSLNYPGGEAITSVRHIISQTQWPEGHNKWERLYVHMDVLSCMTGVTRFQEIPTMLAEAKELPIIDGVPTHIVFDKEENEEKLLEPLFWEKFDYALMEVPGKAIGKWEVVDTIYAYAGMEFLRPGQGDDFAERVYAANSLTKDGGVMESEDVKEAAEKPIDLESGSKGAGIDSRVKVLADLKATLFSRDLNRHGVYKLVKNTVRSLTGGYWLGPRMEPAIRILKRIKEPAA